RHFGRRTRSCESRPHDRCAAPDTGWRSQRDYLRVTVAPEGKDATHDVSHAMHRHGIVLRDKICVWSKARPSMSVALVGCGWRYRHVVHQKNPGKRRGLIDELVAGAGFEPVVCVDHLEDDECEVFTKPGVPLNRGGAPTHWRCVYR